MAASGAGQERAGQRVGGTRCETFWTMKAAPRPAGCTDTQLTGPNKERQREPAKGRQASLQQPNRTERGGGGGGGLGLGGRLTRTPTAHRTIGNSQAKSHKPKAQSTAPFPTWFTLEHILVGRTRRPVTYTTCSTSPPIPLLFALFSTAWPASTHSSLKRRMLVWG